MPPSLQPQSLETLRLLARKIARLRLLEQKERHQGPGGLIEFVKDFWRVLEPSTEFVDGWPLRAMCLPYNTKILTADGEKNIGDIVVEVAAGASDVLSFDHKIDACAWRPIVARMKSCGQPLFAGIETSGRCGALYLTDNHPLFVDGRGYVRADEIEIRGRGHRVSIARPVTRCNRAEVNSAGGAAIWIIALPKRAENIR